MEPQYGGEITFLLEAETNTWDIPGANCVQSCINVMRAVSDPLTIIDDTGTPQPFLLASIVPNEDFTVWELTMRDGITFHDGTPADGVALARHFTEYKAGALQGQILRDLTTIEQSGPMSVTLTFTQPISQLPVMISERTGYFLSPTSWDDVEGRKNKPIGTGPFVFDTWTPGESLVVVRNENYWRTDDAGRQLPFLDQITFRPNPDVAARRATMEAGDAAINMDSFGENLEFWTTEWDGGFLDEQLWYETTHLIFQTSAPPFDNPDLRRALALCTDRQTYINLRSPGVQMANGPFAPGVPGYLEDTGFPEFDADAGRALLDEIGDIPTIEYGTTNVPSNLVTAQFFADQWAQNCGLDVAIDQFDQAELVTRLLTGDFQVILSRNHGEVTAANEFVWWHSRHASGLALNFGKIQDPELDAALEAAAATDDPAELTAAAEEINRIFGEKVYNIWLEWTSWIVPFQAELHNVGVVNLPDGGRALPMLHARVWLQEAWLEQ